ncbi:hypothetical protein JCM8547_006655 [Rhodosporidiobolus lusitaniae]
MALYSNHSHNQQPACPAAGRQNFSSLSDEDDYPPAAPSHPTFSYNPDEDPAYLARRKKIRRRWIWMGFVLVLVVVVCGVGGGVAAHEYHKHKEETEGSSGAAVATANATGGR